MREREVPGASHGGPGWAPSLALGPILQHLGLIVAGGSLLLVAIRVLSVSAYDPTTATAYLHAQGTGSVVVGSLVDFWPLLALASLGVILAVRRRVPPNSASTRLVLTAMAACWLIFLVPLAFTLLVALALLIARIVRRLRGGRAGPPSFSRLPHVEVAVSVALLLAMGIAVNPTPWTPAERIDVAGDVPPIVGYVLTADNDALTVMLQEPRQVVRITADSVQSREICRVRSGVLLRRLPAHMRVLAPPYGLLLSQGNVPEYADCP